jgi:CRP-like cAMP-binding protein
MRPQRTGHSPNDLTDTPRARSKLIAALTPMAIRCFFARGAVLFRQGRKPGSLFIISKGKVRLSFHASDGQHTHRIAGPGHVLGLPATIANQPYSLTATTLEPCELAVIDGMRVRTLLRHRNDLTLWVLDILAEEVRRVRKQGSALLRMSSDRPSFTK